MATGANIAMRRNLERTQSIAHASQRLREAVVGLFTPDVDGAVTQLQGLPERAWTRNMLWLDASGMALYLLHRLEELGEEEVLPISVLTRLWQNLADNRDRTAWLFAEMIEINRRFEELGIRFANLKGMTLAPASVPDPALRCQLDLDFLVATEDTEAVQKVMTDMGYTLHAIESGTWEFKAGSSQLASIKDLYKAKPQRSAEIHFVDLKQDDGGQRPSTWRGQLQRAEIRPVCGTPMRVLSPADQFLNQAMHLFGHLRSEFTRTSWGLEFARHLQSRREDESFWTEVMQLAEAIPDARLALGVTLMLVEEIFAISIPPRIHQWSVFSLPPSVALWARLYGRKAVLGDHPGSKLYLLLEAELAGSQQTSTFVRKRLIPRKAPLMVTHGVKGESLIKRLGRYRAQAWFVLYRLRFHLVQGLRYSIEAARWQRAKAGLLR